VKVRPSGVNGAFPPTVTTGPPSGFSVEMELDDGELLFVEVKNEKTVVDSLGPYYRWIGRMTGKVGGGEEMGGACCSWAICVGDLGLMCIGFTVTRRR
jgi:hypothetical protein